MVLPLAYSLYIFVYASLYQKKSFMAWDDYLCSFKRKYMTIRRNVGNYIPTRKAMHSRQTCKLTYQSPNISQPKTLHFRPHKCTRKILEVKPLPRLNHLLSVLPSPCFLLSAILLTPNLSTNFFQDLIQSFPTPLVKKSWDMYRFSISVHLEDKLV